MCVEQDPVSHLMCLGPVGVRQRAWDSCLVQCSCNKTKGSQNPHRLDLARNMRKKSSIKQTGNRDTLGSGSEFQKPWYWIRYNKDVSKVEARFPV